MRTNEQFKQEIIKRAEKYKKYRRKQRKRIICSFSAIVVCAVSLSAILFMSGGVKTIVDLAKGSSDSSYTSKESEYFGKSSSNYQIKVAALPGTEAKGNTKSENGEYFAEIITDKTTFYTSEKDLVLAVYIAVNNTSETVDTEEAQYESVTDGEVYEITIVCAGEEHSYSFNGNAIKKGDSDWTYISESAAEGIKATIDKIM